MTITFPPNNSANLSSVATPTGNPTSDTGLILNAINEAFQNGGGKVSLAAGTYIVTGNLPLRTNVHIFGAGIDATIIKLANNSNADIFVSDDFSNQTNTDIGGGPHSFSLQSFTIDGNRTQNVSGRGVAIYGVDFTLRDLRIHDCANDGLWTEWADIGDKAGLPHAMESYAVNVKSHHNSGCGFSIQGPHDGFWQECVAYHNDGGFNFRIWRNSHGSLLRTCHAWGDTPIGVSLEQNGAQWEQGDAETKQQAGGVCLQVLASDCRVSGKIWSPGIPLLN